MKKLKCLKLSEPIAKDCKFSIASEISTLEELEYLQFTIPGKNFVTQEMFQNSHGAFCLQLLQTGSLIGKAIPKNLQCLTVHNSDEWSNVTHSNFFLCGLLDGIAKASASGVEKHGLWSLNLSGCELHSTEYNGETFSLLVSSLQVLPYLKIIDLSRNLFELKKIVELMGHTSTACRQLREVNVSGNCFCVSQVSDYELLGRNLTANKNLKLFDMTGINSNQVEFFIGGLQEFQVQKLQSMKVNFKLSSLPLFRTDDTWMEVRFGKVFGRPLVQIVVTDEDYRRTLSVHMDDRDKEITSSDDGEFISDDSDSLLDEAD